MTTSTEEVESAARRLLAERHGLDAVFRVLSGAERSTISLIQSFRAVTGLSLRWTQSLLQDFQNGRSLAHVDHDVVGLLREIPALRGHYGYWIASIYFEAVVSQRPSWTATPAPGENAIHYWCQEVAGGEHYASLSGPRVDFESFRREMSEAVRTDSFFQRHAAIVRDTPEIVTYRFTFL